MSSDNLKQTYQDLSDFQIIEYKKRLGYLNELLIALNTSDAPVNEFIKASESEVIRMEMYEIYLILDVPV
jgi:hypothetical protein